MDTTTRSRLLAAVMLAGRIGGALTAELGTRNVSEPIDAGRSCWRAWPYS